MLPDHTGLPPHRAPRAVGPMVGKPLPDALVWVGTRVVLHDGRMGVVQHYEYYNPNQADFPVRVGPLTLMLCRRHLRSIDEPTLPAPRPEQQLATATL